MGEQTPPASPVIETRIVERPAASRHRPVIDLRTSRPEDRFDLVTVAVTGGAGTLGSAIATELARRGARVMVFGRDLARLNRVDSASGTSSRMVALECDLGSVSAVRSAADFVIRMGIDVDVVVHAAGVRVTAGIADGDVDDLDEQYLINLRAPYLLTQLLEPAMAQRPHVILFTTGPHAGVDEFGAQFLMVQRSLDGFAHLLREENPAMRVTTLRPAISADAASRVRETVAAVIYSLTAPTNVEPSAVQANYLAASYASGHLTPVSGAAWS